MTALDPALGAILRLGLALLFATASAHKWRDLAAFRAALAEYRLLPASWIGKAAAAAALGEALGAACLLTPAGRAAGAALLASLLLVYAAAIAVNLLRGRRDIDCGCAGPAGRQSLSEWLVVRNLVLAGAAAVCALPPGSRPLGAVDALTFALGTATAAALYAALDRLIANRSRLRRLEV